jgi:cytochrome b561
MSLRTRPEGYGLVTKVLHWLTVLVVAAQLVVGYTMDLDGACDPPGEERSGGDTTDVEEERLDRIEDLCEARADELVLLNGPFDRPEVHLLLGLTVLTLAVVRLGWRRYDGFPSWSEHLSEGERRLVHWTERVLLALLFVVPLSGLVLVATGDDGVLWLHVGAHIAFFVTLAAHLFTNLRPRILARML